MLVRRLTASALLAPALVLAPLVSPAGAAPVLAGSLDTTFSPNAPAGVTDPVAGHRLVDVAVQRDGKVVAVSDQGGDFWVVRYATDGSVDPSFGPSGTGVVTVDVGGAGMTDQATAVAVDAQDRVVVAGRGGAAISDFALVRLSPDGRAVQINTHVHVGAPSVPSLVADLAFQSNGTIVLAGAGSVGNSYDFAAARFDGLTGAVVGTPATASLGTGEETASGVAVVPSGPFQDRVVLVGSTGTPGNTAFGIVRLRSDLAFDGDFGAPLGRVVVDPSPGNDTAAGIAVTPTGSLLVAGTVATSDNDLGLVQLRADGSADTGFAGGGVRVLARSGNDTARNHPVAVQPDGTIVVAGDVAGGADAGVFRLDPAGALDAGFGQGGSATFGVNGNDDAAAVAVDGQGRVLVAGADGTGAGFVARLVGLTDSDGDGVPDATDACPTVAGTAASGCAPTPGRPEALLKGRKVVLDTVLAHKGAGKCPRTATVKVKSKGIRATEQLKTRAVAGGCRVQGKVRLPAKPKKSAAVKVKVTGKRLVTERLVAVRR